MQDSAVHALARVCLLKGEDQLSAAGCLFALIFSALWGLAELHPWLGVWGRAGTKRQHRVWAQLSCSVLAALRWVRWHFDRLQCQEQKHWHC